MVEFATHGLQAGLNVAETLAVSELSESHRQILIPTRQASVVTIAIIARHTLLEFDVREVGDQLRENGSADIHPPVFRRSADGVQHDLSRRFRPFSAQIVFVRTAYYAVDGKGVAGIGKALYRTLVS
jgi:hypothetical protein